MAIIGVFGTLLTGFLTYMFNTYAKPWLEAHNLTALAEIAVNAAEAIIGSGHGDEKLEKALEFMAEKGFNVDSTEVKAALEAAWQKLNVAQTAAGIKPVALE